jgi:hypothetical protein
LYGFSLGLSCGVELSFFQVVKAAEEEKNKVREQRRRAAQEEILRLEQVAAFLLTLPSFLALTRLSGGSSSQVNLRAKRCRRCRTASCGGSSTPAEKR